MTRGGINRPKAKEVEGKRGLTKLSEGGEFGCRDVIGIGSMLEEWRRGVS